MKKTKKYRGEENLIRGLLNRFLPYWPIFAGILLICILAAWSYLNFFSTKQYEASATLIIKDEKRGVDDSKIMQSLNAFDSKKIVENEVEVIQSREIMLRVVKKLTLFAPIYIEEEFKDKLAFYQSPVVLEFENPDDLNVSLENSEKYYFTYTNDKKVKFLGKEYGINEWIDFSGGRMRFVENENKIISTTKKKFYFQLMDPVELSQAMIDNLEVNSTDKLSTVVTLSYTSPSPRLSEDILNNVITKYNSKAIEDRNFLAENTLRFIDARMDSVEAELNNLELSIEEYRSTSGAVDLSEQGKLYLKDVGDNNRRISDIRMQLAVLNRVENYVISKNNQAGIVPSTVGIDDQSLSQLLEKLYNSEIQYERLKKTTAENNPLLLSIKNEIDKIRPSILENIRNQKNNLNTSLSNLNATSGRYNEVLSSIPEKERALLEITRKKTEKNDLYAYLVQKREETALAYAPGSGDGRVVDLAHASRVPASPKPKMVYAISILFAFLVAVGYITSKEILNNNILFRSEIEKSTEIPIVAELVEVKNKNSKRNNLKKIANSEQFRDLRLALGLFGNTANRNKIVVTSSIEGEGKSFVSEGLALNLSSAGKRVVLVNMDFHKKESSTLFTNKKANGVSELLAGKTNIHSLLQDTSHDNLKVISAGELSNQTSNYVLDYDFNPLFKYLDAHFDYIIIDTPPVAVATDAFVISRFCDYTLFIVRHGYTPKNILQNLELNHNLTAIERLYIVFNGVKERGYLKGKYGQNYGYVQQRAAYMS